MNTVGIALIGTAGLAGLAAVLRPDVAAVRLTMMMAWWLGVAWLVTRFVALDLGLAEVVAYSRAELPAWSRGTGAWAGPAGSLLLWLAAMVTAVALAATRSSQGDAPVRPQGDARLRPSRRWLEANGSAWAVRLAGVVSVVGAVVLVAFANPFRLTAMVPVNGRGLSPVLEHPAMAIHPPLLYLAQAAVVFAAVRAGLGTRHGNGRSAGRAPVAGAAAFLMLATLIGAWWAHDELGWGGWWAWDPVENTALAPLAALVASLHAASASARRRWAQGAAGLVLLGVAASRSGLASSVHAFASNAGPAVFIGLAGVVVMGLTLRAVLADPQGTAGNRSRGRVGLIVGTVALWVAMVVVVGELAAMSLGASEEGSALDGGLIARLLIPAGVTVLVGLAIYGWRAPRRVGMVLAHLGVVVFAVGVVASLGDWRKFVVVQVGDPTELRGELLSVGTPGRSDDRADLQRAEVAVVLGNSTYRPRIDRYPDLDRTRARPSRTMDWRGETEVVAAYIDDDRVGLEVRRHPGLGQVWAGGLLTAAGLAVTVVAANRRRRMDCTSAGGHKPTSDVQRGPRRPVAAATTG